MSLLAINPNLEVFSTIPELHDAVVEFNQKGIVDLILSIGNIFVKHNVFNDYGLSMIHRHFNLDKQEILVEVMRADNDLSIFSPWVLIDKLAKPADQSVLQGYGITGSQKKLVVPQNWCFTAGGNLEAFEYLATDDDTLPTPTEEFVNELYAALKKLGVEHVVGLRRIVNLRGRNSWETTPEGLRANVLVYDELPEELKKERMVPVLWKFDKDGKLLKESAWCGNCCNHCNHCSHCGSHTY